MASLHLQLDMNVTLDSTGFFHLESLRIQLPEELEPISSVTEKEEPNETSKIVSVALSPKEDDDNTEYIPASPLYTWSDEHVIEIKRYQFGELLWPVILRSYGLAESPSRRSSTYSSFLQSYVFRHSEQYPHHSVSDLMKWYIEENFHILKANHKWTTEEKLNLERRRLLRQCFFARRIVWMPEYMNVYLEWSKSCSSTMNRYQKINKFISEFFL